MRVNDVVKRSGHEAVWIIAHALGVSHSEVYARGEFSSDEAAKIEAMIARREAGEPLQYIMGEADFYGRDFAVGKGVLIPRHDTETLITAAGKILGRDEAFCFTDWGTGSGCIAVTMLMEFPKAYAYLVEASEEARKFARANLERYNLNERAEFVEVVPECELIISNPPYIPSDEIWGLMREVKDYEPISALDGGKDGLKFYREIFKLGLQSRSNYIILEAGSTEQVNLLEDMCNKFVLCDTILDGGNFPRCLVFRRCNHVQTQ